MKSKLIAICIFAFIFLVPFRMAFLSDEIANSGKFILGFFSTIIGFIVAFGIGTNEPFDKKPKAQESHAADAHQMKKAA